MLFLNLRRVPCGSELIFKQFQEPSPWFLSALQVKIYLYKTFQHVLFLSLITPARRLEVFWNNSARTVCTECPCLVGMMGRFRFMLTYWYSSYQESHGCNVPHKSHNWYNYDGFRRCGFSFKLAQRSEMPPTPSWRGTIGQLHGVCPRPDPALPIPGLRGLVVQCSLFKRPIYRKELTVKAEMSNSAGNF